MPSKSDSSVDSQTFGHDESSVPLIGESAASVTTIEDEVNRLDQALLDLEHSGATSVNLIHCPSPSRESTLVRELGRAARARGFVSAEMAMSDTPLDSLEELVASLIDALVPPGETRARGLLYLLDTYHAKYMSRAVGQFEKAAEAEGAEGDLVSFCSAYLAATDDAAREVRSLTLWSEGHDLKPRQLIAGVRGTLDAHSAQRVLGQLTRIVRALGHKGLFIQLSGGEQLAARTPRQREKGYTVLRELVDNFDSGRGAIATRICLSGGDALFEGPHSLRMLPPLFMRLALSSDAQPPPPHRTWTSLIREPYEYVHRRVRAPEDAKPSALRALIRGMQGLPPVEAVTAMSVGHERIDRAVTQLFHHAENAGSVFQVITGEYGSGKTHLLLHLAERALSQGHPVFWLNLERLNLDLGNPARHLARVLEQSIMPRRGRPNALDRASSWTRSRSRLKELLAVLEDIAGTETEEAAAAKKAIAVTEGVDKPGAVLEEYLSARDLVRKPGNPNYRQDAYRRLLLWAALLRRMDQAEGPVLLIDEAENLYTTGVSRTLRRSALRSLSFYCGGALPEACVVLAMTPPALAQMRQESGTLLAEQSEVDSTLPLEDVLVFKRRLAKLSPEQVPPLTRPMRLKLAEQVRQVHRSVRGPVKADDWDAVVREVTVDGIAPRVLVRRLVDHLEAAWWGGA
jgi:hypothetical protein